MLRHTTNASGFSFAVDVPNGFLKFLGVLRLCDNTLGEASHHEPQVLWTMTEEYDQARTPTCTGYLRDQRRIFSAGERQQDNVWIDTTKLLHCLYLCCCFRDNVKSFPTRD